MAMKLVVSRNLFWTVISAMEPQILNMAYSSSSGITFQRKASTSNL